MNSKTNNTRSGKILIVDDSDANLQLLTNLLKEQGHSVYPASDGELALEFVHSTPPDLILLDSRMPGMDGYAVCSKLKADEKTRSIPVIFISVLEDERDKMQAFQAGGIDYITKPIRPEEVLARVNTHLRLRKLTEHLGHAVAERTQELEEVNQELLKEIDKRKQAEQELTLLNFAMNNVQEAAFLIDADAHFRYVNDDACRILGYTRDELLKLSVSDVDPDFPAERWLGHWDDLQKNHSFFFESHHRTKDGHVFPVEISANYFEYGGRGYNLALVRDITDRKHSAAINAVRLHLVQFSLNHSLDGLLEETLNETEKLTDSLIGFYHFVDDDQKSLTLQNWSTRTKSEFCKAEGKGLHYAIDQAGVWVDCVYQRRPIIHNDYISLPHRKGIPEGHAQVIRELVVPVFRGEKISAILGVGNKPTDYTEKDVETVSLIASMAWEIAERKQAEEALRENEERFRQITENMLDAVSLVDRNGVYQYVSPSHYRILGYRPEDMLGKPAVDFVAPEDLDAMAVAGSKLANDGEVTFQYRFRHADGYYVWGEANAKLLFDAAGNVSSVVLAGRNITDRKRAEEEVQILNQELEQRVKERTAELEAFSYSVSHDLRAPLRTIDGFSQVLLEDYEDKLDEQGKSYLARIKRATIIMGNLIEDMLKLYKVSRTEMVVSPVNLSAIARSVTDELHRTQPERQAEFIIADNLVASADQGLIRVIFENLLGNAWKFTGKTANAEIEFGETIKDGKKIFFIRDNGAGFDMEYAHKLFAPFQRLHSAEEYQGTGIGLAIVKRIINRHGGRVWAEAQSGKGATFYFTLQE